MLREDSGRLLQKLLNNGAAFHRPLSIPTGKGVRQGDTISPMLFTTALQRIMKLLEWDERGRCCLKDLHQTFVSRMKLSRSTTEEEIAEGSERSRGEI